MIILYSMAIAILVVIVIGQRCFINNLRSEAEVNESTIKMWRDKYSAVSEVSTMRWDRIVNLQDHCKHLNLLLIKNRALLMRIRRKK